MQKEKIKVIVFLKNKREVEYCIKVLATLESVELRKIKVRTLFASCAKEVLMWLKGASIVIVEAGQKDLVAKILRKGILVIQTWSDPARPFLFGDREITPTSIQDTPSRIKKELWRMKEINFCFN